MREIVQGSAQGGVHEIVEVSVEGVARVVYGRTSASPTASTR